jgi:hypothetical protein
MNILSVNFQELYARHLCRHSQFGINVAHLASVIVTYVGLFALVYWLGAPWWLVLGLLLPYLAVLAFNLPPRLLAVTLLFYALFVPLVFLLPSVPIWLALVLSVVLVVLGHKSQAWSHRVWTDATDMTEFDKKYRKGPALFFLLSVYELPILLHYLVFCGPDKRSEAFPVPSTAPDQTHLPNAESEKVVSPDQGESGVCTAGVDNAPATAND